MSLRVRNCVCLALTTFFGATCAGWAIATPKDDGAITVFAAASLTNVVTDIARDFTDAHDVSIQLSFASSAALARQIEYGAPADLFLSANSQWIDYLQEKDLVRPQDRRSFAENELVLVTRKSKAPDTFMLTKIDILDVLNSGRFSIADPSSSPAGRYARSALTSLGIWDTIKPSLATAPNARSALMLVSTGATPLGLVYRSDALLSSNVRVLATLPKHSQPEIMYELAMVSTSSREGEKFLDYLSSPPTRQTLKNYGFDPVPLERQQ